MICFTPFFPQNDTLFFQQLSGEIEVIGAKHLEPKLVPAKYGITSIQIPEYFEARKDLRAPRAVELASLSRQRRVRIRADSVVPLHQSMRGPERSLHGAEQSQQSRRLSMPMRGAEQRLQGAEWSLRGAELSLAGAEGT